MSYKFSLDKTAGEIIEAFLSGQTVRIMETYEDDGVEAAACCDLDCYYYSSQDGYSFHFPYMGISASFFADSADNYPHAEPTSSYPYFLVDPEGYGTGEPGGK